MRKQIRTALVIAVMLALLPAGAATQITDSLVMQTSLYYSANNGDWIEKSEYKKVGKFLRRALADTLLQIRITGWADKVGTPAANERMSLRRARTVRNYLVRKGVSTDRIQFSGCGVDTQAPTDKEARRADLLELAIAPVAEVKAEELPRETQSKTEMKETIFPTAPEKLDVSANIQETAPDDSQETVDTDTGQSVKKPLFAIKTNLLFDAVSALNVEVEVPIGRRWSVAGEWIFPWWLWEKKQICLQMLSGNVEGRYWFGNRNGRKHLTGWFAGLYMGGGLYDLEWKTKGYQGEFFVAAGVSSGYVHTINKSGSLRMEYSLGIGYMRTGYREYTPMNSGEILSWQRDGRYSWFGPTRAKISLVWMLNYRQKGGRK